MQLGDLVRSKYDISRGVEGPLGIVIDIHDWKRGTNTYVSVKVWLFKHRCADTFSIDQLEVIHDMQN
jgi:hypothetical protein